MIYAELKEKRKRYNISQTKLSEASGYSKSQISSWELGKSTPKDDEISQINNVLSKMIQDIDNRVFDVRKRRITYSKRKKSELPLIIKNADEYRSLLLKRDPTIYNPYAGELTNLFRRAQYSKDKNAPKTIALFSGCGGLSLGFAAEGFHLIGHVEIEDAANRIYHDNFPNSKLLEKNICDITDVQMKNWLSQYGNIDVIIGGPPCQGFSLAGKRDPEDMRNQLYKYYVYAVSMLHPQVFVMENVRLLTSMRNLDGQFFIDRILRSFSDTGYKIVWREINAYDYGVPQSRERVILIGVRNDLNKNFIFPDGEYGNKNQSNFLFTPKKRLTFRDATFDLQQLESGEKSSDPLHWSVIHPEHVIKWLENVPEGKSAHENADPALRPPSGFNTSYKRILWDEPCSTIATNFSMISGCRNVHPTSTRSLTIREAARVQSFPDEFIFFGKWGDIRKAIGNAVPPILASALAKSIYKQFFDIKYT